VFLAAYVPQQARDPDGYSRAYQTVIEKISAIRRLATMYPDRCELATTPDEVERIAARDKRAIMLGIENGYAIGMDLANVQRFHDLGVRYITLSHNGHNQICDSCNPARKLGDGEAEHHGLSPFGRQVVAEMNRLGILIDVSHVAPSSLRDAVALSQAPVIASHSGCSAVFEHPRNLSDEQLRMLQAHGGVIQVVAVAGFLKRKASEKDKPDSRDPSASVQDFVDHIDHAVRVAGVEHVGLGSDFDGGGGIRGFQNHAEALNVTIELVRRGYTEDAIAKIWGANLLRVWREAQATAMRLNDKRP
jgi:membrane dipeptidase